MNWKATRGAVYVTATLSAGATLAAAMGYGTYDPQTGMFDLHPFDVRGLALLIVSGVGPVLASVALWKDWGQK